MGNLYIADAQNNRVRRVGAADGVATTIAGNGVAGYSGDGGLATAGSLNVPVGLAVDNSSNLYIADAGNNVVRKVTPAGTITTIAGDGTEGFSGDGGPATAASLTAPAGVTVDSGGNIYISDPGNRIRKVTPAGIITTVAGTGIAGFSGDGGPAIAASIRGPVGVAVDSLGNLYIADYANKRIRKVSPDAVMSTIAGVGGSTFGDGGPATAALLNSPAGMAIDTAGNLYITDQGDSRTRKVTPAGTITTVAGSGTAGFSGDGGPAGAALLNSPLGVTLDSTGNVYIADVVNNRIRKVTADGIISTVAGNGTADYTGDGGPATAASLNTPTGVAADGTGNLYVADAGNNRIRKVTPAGVISTFAGNGTADYTGDGGLATAASLNTPLSVAVDNAGNVFIADAGNNRVRKATQAGVISTFAGNGIADYTGDGRQATVASLDVPAAVTLDGTGNVYIADTGNNRIRKVTSAGVISTVAGDGTAGYTGDGASATSAPLSAPSGVAVNGAGTLYIASGPRILAVSSEALLSRIGSFAQLASGGGWKTTFTVVNISSSSVTARIKLYADNGNPLSLPLSFPQSGVVTTDSVAEMTIPAKGSAVVESESSASTTIIGWADIEASVVGSVSGFEIMRLRQSGRPDSEVTVPLDPGATFLTVPFDETSGFKTGVGIASQSGVTTVNITVRDDAGNVLVNSQVPLAAFGHNAFFLSTMFPQASNRRGIAELQVSGGTIAGMGLRMSPSISFTAMPTVR
jgi:hypothetical protein